MPLLLSRYHRINMIFGANTNVGKTVISAGLVNAAAAAAANSTNTAHSHCDQHHVRDQLVHMQTL